MYVFRIAVHVSAKDETVFVTYLNKNKLKYIFMN